jgi:TPP-dependent trihydroxycyclohexane-1,2-dione (THcHDO) dehydratase
VQAAETESKIGVSTAPADTSRILHEAMLTRVALRRRVTDRPAIKVDRRTVAEIAGCKARRVKDKERKLKRALLNAEAVKKRAELLQLELDIEMLDEGDVSGQG